METSLQKNTGAIGRATVPLRMLLERAKRWEGGRGGSIAQQRGVGGAGSEIFRGVDGSARRSFAHRQFLVGKEPQ